ncbi:threonine synthase [Candidatus Neomarinimicrobiota bacterium]
MTQHLECRVCGESTDCKPETVCPICFGPLEVAYDYEEVGRTLTRDSLSLRPMNMWRYYELLPEVDTGPPDVAVGCTPLVRAKRLGEALGMPNLYLKNDAVNFPSLSFKDRVVTVALAKAIDFGFKVVGCASTGNLAGAVAAQATLLGLESIVLVPRDLEDQKIVGTACYKTRVIKVDGNYDDVNRLCTELTYREHIGIVNVNLRPFYAEGSKTVGFEIVEQLDWNLPDQIVVPMAGGSLISKIGKAFHELVKVGLAQEKEVKFYGAQATGCSPITTMVKNGEENIIPVKPDTIVKSLAIGAPADGRRAAHTIRDSGGWGEDVTDQEVIDGILLLAETEGIFAETAGGVTVGVTRKLLKEGQLDPEAVTVLCITGNGLKTSEVISFRSRGLPVILPKFSSFQEYWQSIEKKD